jgi:ferric-dicitrate binding protein FerR (iron transport regulator)
VQNRKGKTRVVLNSGKVKLNLLSTEQEDNLYMEPGELVELSGDTELVKKTVVPENYSSWKNKKWIFDDTSLEEIAEMVENTYDIKISFGNPDLSGLTLTGSAPAGDIEMLIKIIEKSFTLKITRYDKTMLIDH